MLFPLYKIVPVQQGGLARAVGTDNPQYFPLLDRESDVIDGHQAAESF
jgi:hypothetical protein